MVSPWHTCMHGLDIGRRPLRFADPVDAAPLLRLSQRYVERAASRPFARWVAVLVQEALGERTTSQGQGHGGASLRDIWHTLNWPLDRSMGCALAVNVLSQTSMWHTEAAWLNVLADACLCEALDNLTRAQHERERYAMAMGAVALIHAFSRHGKAHLLGSCGDGREPLGILVGEIAHLQAPFLRGRCLGVLLDALNEADQSAVVVSSLGKALSHEMRVLDGMLAKPVQGLRDGIHMGHDHLLFPMSLLLSGAARWSSQLIERSVLANFAGLMRLLFDSASIRSQASQWRFCSAALVRLACIDREQALDITVDLAQRYLAARCDQSADAYLRCCYLLTTAERFDARDLLPSGLERPLYMAPIPGASDTETLELKYRRQTMWSAYALFASGMSSSLNLAMTCSRLETAWSTVDETWDEAGCMELGHALVDAALDLRQGAEKKWKENGR